MSLGRERGGEDMGVFWEGIKGKIWFRICTENAGSMFFR